MSMMRRTLLALSTNAWLREQATQADFVRRAVREFMPGETIEDALRAAEEQQRAAERPQPVAHERAANN